MRGYTCFELCGPFGANSYRVLPIVGEWGVTFLLAL